MFKPPKLSSNQSSDLPVSPTPPNAPFGDFPSSPATDFNKQEISSDLSSNALDEARVQFPISEPPTEISEVETANVETESIETPNIETSSIEESKGELSDIESPEADELIPEPTPDNSDPSVRMDTDSTSISDKNFDVEEDDPERTIATEELVADPEDEFSSAEENTKKAQDLQAVPPMSFDTPMPPVPAAVPTPPAMDEKLRYARPTKRNETEESNTQSTETVDEYEMPSGINSYTPNTPMDYEARDNFITSEYVSSAESDNPIDRVLGKDQKRIQTKSISDIPFSDIWYTAEKVAYIRDKSTKFALIPFESEDLEDFYKALEQGYTGQSSFAIRFAGEQYRVERIITLTGPQYNCRKMPGSVPDIFSLGLPKHIVDYLLTLSNESGLLLFGGPTGMGKTTSASALMKKYLEMEGGFMYTIEDPPEMPLDGIYYASNGALGLCKQCPVDNERWGDGIKSSLRSRPRYILVGEIRTPETASQVLRAATSGHLVLSTIHASTVEDALESVIKYASGAGLTESLAADLLARGILGVIHQKLEGVATLRPVITAAFANPHLTGGDQMRSLIRNQTINLQTLIEAQSSRLFQGRPLFSGDNKDKD